jgi:hypothetical protein
MYNTISYDDNLDKSSLMRCSRDDTNSGTHNSKVIEMLNISYNNNETVLRSMLHNEHVSPHLA